MTDQSDRPSGLLALGRIARRRVRLITACALLVPIVAVALSLAQGEEFETTATLAFRESHVDEVIVGTNILKEPEDEETLAQTTLGLARTDAVARRTAKRLGDGTTKDEVARRVTVKRRGEALVFDVVATAPTAEAARRTAEVFAEEVGALRRYENRLVVRKARLALVKTLRDLPPDAPGAPEIRDRISRLQQLQSEVPDDMQVVDRADRPAEASSPKPIRSGLIGLVVGPLLGFGLALLVDRSDRRLKDANEAGAVLGEPPLAQIPESPVLAGQTLDPALSTAEMEPFRALRTHIRHDAPGSTIRSVLVASPAPEDGRTTVAWHLARAAASVGMEVLLLEADLRRPALAARLGESGTPGLIEVLNGEAGVRDVARSTQDPGANGSARSTGWIELLPAGRSLDSSIDLIDSTKMREVVEEVEREYDLVIVDSPPSSEALDALALASMASATIVVNRLWHTPRKGAGELREQLRRVDARVLGLALVGAARSRVRSDAPPDEPVGGQDAERQAAQGSPAA